MAPASPIIDMRMPTLMSKYGLWIQRCLLSGPTGGLLLIPGLAVGTLIFRYLLVSLPLTRHADRDFATFLGFVLSIIEHVISWRRANGYICKESDTCLVRIRECLQDMLRSIKS